MSANTPDLRHWEYRQQCFFPEDSLDSLNCREQDPEFIDWLIKKLENIEDAEEGWQMVQAKIESDENGRCRLEVIMKRPLADSKKLPDDSFIPHAA
jgi:hypothetical protein